MTDLESLATRAQNLRDTLALLLEQSRSLQRNITTNDGNSGAGIDAAIACHRTDTAIDAWDRAIAEMSAGIAVAGLAADASEEAYHEACAKGDPRWRVPA
jgi:hypothetical protein